MKLIVLIASMKCTTKSLQGARMLNIRSLEVAHLRGMHSLLIVLITAVPLLL